MHRRKTAGGPLEQSRREDGPRRVRKSRQEGGAAIGDGRLAGGHERDPWETGDLVPVAYDEGERAPPLDPDPRLVGSHIRAGKEGGEPDASIGVYSGQRSGVDLECPEERAV